MVYSDYGASTEYGDRVAQMAGSLQSENIQAAGAAASKYADQLKDADNYNDKIKTILNPITDQFVRSAVESVHDTLGKGVQMGLNRAKGMASKASKALEEKTESTLGKFQNPLFDKTVVDNNVKKATTDIGDDLQSRAGSLTRDITGNTPTEAGEFSDAGRAARFMGGEEQIDNVTDPAGKGPTTQEDTPQEDTSAPEKSAGEDLFKEPDPLENVKDSSQLGQDAGEDAGKAAEDTLKQAAEGGLKKGAEDAGLDAAAGAAEGAAAGEGGLNPIADIAAVGLAVGSLFAEKKLEKKAPVDVAPEAQNVAQASEVRGI
tara:strand:+ start:221 stop:1171 length:951 start_codon:yes stop_codon:yes gene_type:complete